MTMNSEQFVPCPICGTKPSPCILHSDDAPHVNGQHARPVTVAAAYRLGEHRAVAQLGPPYELWAQRSQIYLDSVEHVQDELKARMGSLIGQRNLGGPTKANIKAAVEDTLRQQLPVGVGFNVEIAEDSDPGMLDVKVQVQPVMPIVMEIPIADFESEDGDSTDP